MVELDYETLFSENLGSNLGCHPPEDYVREANDASK